MKKDIHKFNILPGVGIGMIRFGMSQEDVKKILGEPIEIKTDEENDVFFKYKEESICQYYFYKENDYKLSMIEISRHKKFELFGITIFLIPFNKVKKIFEERGFFFKKQYLLEEKERNYFQSLYTLEKYRIDFWVNRKNYLDEVSFSVFYDKNDRVKWPNEELLSNVVDGG